MEEVDKLDHGWKDSEAQSECCLRTNMDKKELIPRIKSLEVVGDGDKSADRLDKPKDVKNSISQPHHSFKLDDQWLYLPAIKRVKRIASANKSGPFVGSEFTYEDLSSFELKKI